VLVPRTLILALGLATACSARSPRTATWLTSIGGTREAGAYGQAVAVAPAGGAAMVWEARGVVRAGTQRFGVASREPVLVLSTYDRAGVLAWSRRVASPTCPAPTFAPALWLAPDGGAVVAVAERPGGQICVLRFDARGAIAWSLRLDELRGIPALGVATDGQIALTGAHEFEGVHAVVAISPRGAIVWRRELPIAPEQLAVAPAGAIHVVGSVVAGSPAVLVDRDPSTADVDAVELVTLDADGTTRARLPISTPGAGHEPLALVLTADDDAAYVGWNTLTHGPMTWTSHLVKLVAGRVAWSRSERGVGLGAIAAADGVVATVRVAGGDPFVQLIGADGSDRARYRLAGALVESQVPISGLSLAKLAMSAGSLALTGYAEKRVEIDAVGTIRTSCRWVSHQQPGMEVVRYEACDPAAWLARFSLARPGASAQGAR